MSVRQSNEFAGLDAFVWFFGIVEARNDPLNVGRVKVRAFGWHSPDRNEVPVDSLPWAQVMTPATSAATSGIGQSPTGLQEGSLVFGFFLDGRNAQQPMIMGSIPGVPQLGPGRGQDGFTDPNALYPISSEVGNPDTPKLAYSRWTEDKVTTDKTASRTTGIPTASGPKLDQVSREDAIASGTWDEPVQRGTADSAYPFNHVTQTESGHAVEFDDTPGAERIHVYHRTGTFTEIQSDGTRISKIVGKDYEIVADDKNVLITGSCNITINGDARMLIKGDKIEEINGNYHLTIHGSRLVKMDGNDLLEVASSRSEAIGIDDTTFVAGIRTTTIAKTESHVVGQDSTTVVNGKLIMASVDNMDLGSGANLNIASDGTMNVKSTSTTEMTATTLNIHNDQNITGTSTASVDHVSNGKSGHDHTHTDTIGLGAGITTAPN